jgi:hypothetical protein
LFDSDGSDIEERGALEDLLDEDDIQHEDEESADEGGVDEGERQDPEEEESADEENLNDNEEMGDDEEDDYIEAQVGRQCTTTDFKDSLADTNVFQDVPHVQPPLSHRKSPPRYVPEHDDVVFLQLRCLRAFITRVRCGRLGAG